jgi:hypothetical protein
LLLSRQFVPFDVALISILAVLARANFDGTGFDLLEKLHAKHI